MRHAEIGDDNGPKLEIDELESKLADYDQNGSLNSEYRNAIAMKLQDKARWYVYRAVWVHQHAPEIYH